MFDNEEDDALLEVERRIKSSRRMACWFAVATVLAIMAVAISEPTTLVKDGLTPRFILPFMNLVWGSVFAVGCVNSMLDCISSMIDRSTLKVASASRSIRDDRRK